MNDTVETKDRETSAPSVAHDVLHQLEQRGMTVAEPRAGGRSATVQAPAVQPTVAVAEMADTDGGTNIGALFGALAKAQGEFGDIERRMTAKIKSKREGGADYSYAYAPLDEVLAAVRPALSKNGIAVMQFPQTKANVVMVRTLLAHETGQRLWNDLAVGCVSTDAKDIGSAITYARRYALMALLGIAPDTDDDGIRGRGEQGQVQSRERRPEPPRPTPPPPSGTAGEERALVTTCRALQRGGKTIYAIKSTVGECFTENTALYEMAQAAARAEQRVVLRTEQRTANGRAYSELVEIVM